MCVAIYKPPGASVSKRDLRACFEKNPDGAGFMYALDGKAVVKKGYFTFAEFWKAYKAAIYGEAKGKGMGIHFRIATSGNRKDVTNCHPHIVADDMAFIHNGILRDYEVDKSELSDTIHFMEDQIKPLHALLGPNFLEKPPIGFLIQKYISSSKMVFLSAEGEGTFWILNKEDGKEKGGCWFSNLYWDWAPARTQSADWPDHWGRNHSTSTGYQVWDNKLNCWVNRGEYRAKEAKEKNATACATTDCGDRNNLKSANAWGCLLAGKWVGWEDYFAIYPKGGGPYDYYLKDREIVDEVTGRKRPALPSVDAKESDGLKQDDPDPVMDEKCSLCKHNLTQMEVDNAEGYCIDCLLDANRLG